MAYIVEYKNAEGKVTLVEVDGTAPKQSTTAPIKISSVEKKAVGVIAKAQITLEEALEGVKPSIVAFVDLVDGLAKKPESVELSFGLKAAGELGLFSVAKASTEANYTLRLTWKA